MRLVVGLGNIGSRYAGNRHNVGFMVVDELAQRLDADWNNEAKLKASIATAEIDGDKVILAKPSTMMNLSGEAVQRIMQFYKIGPDEVLVVFDDLDTEFGKARLRTSGSSGGHNGVQSIIDHIGSEFGRLRIGISMNDRTVEPSETYVLRNFDPHETDKLPALIDGAIGLIESTPDGDMTSQLV